VVPGTIAALLHHRTTTSQQSSPTYGLGCFFVDKVVEVGMLVLAAGILALHADECSCEEASALDVIVG